METIETLRRQIDNAGGLHSLVKTMKTMALVNIRHYEEAVASLQDYFRTVERGFQMVLHDVTLPLTLMQAQPAAPVGIIVVGSEQGMVGQFNDRIAHHAQRCVHQLELASAPSVLTLGARVATHMQAYGYSVADSLIVPSSVGGIAHVVQELVIRIEAWRAEQGIEQVWLYYNRTQSGASYEPWQLQLLPLDAHWLTQVRSTATDTRSLPFYRADRDVLLAALVRQYLFVGLYRAVAESLASENASRLMAMQSAEKNIEERLDDLNTSFQQQRQTAIMNELLDVITGYMMLTED